MFKKIIYIQIVLVALVFCLFLASTAAKDVDEVLCGTWANKEYTQGTQKLIISADGSYVGYTKADPVKACMQGNCKIVEKWSDSRGNHWYKTIFLGEDGGKSYCLMKVSNSGQIIECAHDSKEYPKFFNAEIYTYRKFYRQ